MRRFLQVISILAIAIGVGLFVTGAYLAPDGDEKRTSKSDHEISAVTRGLGAGAIAFGILGLVIPMINALTKARASGGSGSPSPRQVQD